MTAKPWAVYFLRDPRDREIKYVGITTHIGRRLAAHRAQSESSSGKGGKVYRYPKHLWVLELKKLGLMPSMEVQVVVETRVDAARIERELIYQHRTTVLNRVHILRPCPGCSIRVGHRRLRGLCTYCHRKSGKEEVIPTPHKRCTLCGLLRVRARTICARCFKQQQNERISA
jgi:predicted GIY-YIG superfamily endonuclease